MMVTSFKELFGLLSPSQKRQFLVLQFLMILAGIIELFSITSIVPFIGAAADPEILSKNPYVNFLYNALGFTSLKYFLLFSGGLFLAMIVLTNAVQILTLFFLNRYATRIGADFAQSLNRYYLYQPLLYHLANNSSRLTNNVIIECDRVGREMVSPFLRLNARLFSIFILAVFFVALNPWVAVLSLVVLGLAYLVVFRLARRKIGDSGIIISLRNQIRFKLLHESYDGIRDIKLTHTESVYEQDFALHTTTVARAAANNLVLGQAPYYFIEAIAFSGIVAIALYFMSSTAGIGDSLTMLGLYGMIGFRLIPTFQRSYHAVAEIKGAIPAFNGIKNDLSRAIAWEKPNTSAVRIKPVRDISLENVSFTYPDRSGYALQDVNLTIPVNALTVITGRSGAGKSTLIDIMLGLLSPDSGTFKVDGTAIDCNNVVAWQKSIGYVPQQIHISDTTLMENIAFGVPRGEIDQKKLKSACELACIDSLEHELPDGYMTTLGEQGRQLSGGQRQRVGIARALYHDPDVLILDEATSALDATTEEFVMRSLQDISRSKIVIFISHRTKIADIADFVLNISGGAVQLEGK
jgi:ABC-type multidrug transport system fused ATPase/permease subunit